MDLLDFRLKASARASSDRFRLDLERLAARLTALNPLAVLSRGYAIAEKDGALLSSAQAVSVGDRFVLNFQDGVIGCVADSKEDRKL